jgi:hypothetical protein
MGYFDVERVKARYKQVCWVEILMSHLIAVETAEADENLTRGR